MEDKLAIYLHTVAQMNHSLSLLYGLVSHLIGHPLAQFSEVFWIEGPKEALFIVLTIYIREHVC